MPLYKVTPVNKPTQAADKHPTRDTPPPEPLAGGSKGATGQPAVALPPEAYMTEQEKAAIAGAPAAKKETR